MKKLNKQDIKIKRVQQMEEKYDLIYNALHSEENVIDTLNQLKKEIKQLQSYYETTWIKDYDAEKNNEFPKDMKRGILSEDALYDLFSDIDNV